jgi:peptide/nickel transport system substrate-binding protein
MISAALIVASAVAVGSALAGGTIDKKASDASTLIVSRANDPHSLDPAQEVSTGGGLESFVAFYERLINLTPSGKLVPGLATSWKVSGNGLAYTLVLRNGVKFHDGSPLDAAAIRYTWQRIVGVNGAAAQYWKPVKDVVVVNPSTVEIRLAKVNPSFLATLGGQRGVYIGPSKSCVAAHEEKPGDWATTYFNDHECGTGPYTLTSWQHDQELTYDAYKQYWRGWNGKHVTRIVQKIIKEPSTARLMLEQGQLDLAADALPMNILLQLKKNANLRVDVAPTTTIDQFTFNMAKKPTSDPRVRRAIALLFDYNTAIKQAYKGYARRVHGPIPSTIWPTVPKNAARYEHNVAQAKKLLAEAGYKKGLTLNLSAMEINQWKDLVLILQSSLAQGGVTLKVNFMTWPVLFSQLQQPKGKKPFDMAAYQMWAAIPDPSDILMWWDTNATTVINPGWGNTKTDGWIRGAASTLTQSKRVSLYQNVIRQLNADAPGIWIDQPDNLTAMRKNVHGYTYVPYYNGLVDFYALSKS